MSIESIKEGFEYIGMRKEQDRIIALAESMICFDHLRENTCDHGGCWALQELIRKVRRLTDGDA